MANVFKKDFQFIFPTFASLLSILLMFIVAVLFYNFMLALDFSLLLNSMDAFFDIQLIN
jgi:hypothetical protein